MKYKIDRMAIALEKETNIQLNKLRGTKCWPFIHDTMEASPDNSTNVFGIEWANKEEKELIAVVMTFDGNNFFIFCESPAGETWTHTVMLNKDFMTHSKAYTLVRCWL